MHIKYVDGAVEQEMKSAGVVAPWATITTLGLVMPPYVLQVSSKKIFVCE